ncbi:MAG: hypothetical protein HY287_08050 [Planctomycetes bacterium]|nr:hypothetical protein [Planctomycetota bacterium]
MLRFAQHDGHQFRLSTFGGLTCICFLIIVLTGCNYTVPVKAKFKLSGGPVLILLDDIGERVDWPPAKQYLWDDLSQELLRNKAVPMIIPNETLQSLRRTMPDFEKRGAREIGEAAGAEQVLWIETQEFLAEEQIADAQNAAYWSATVKVLNAQEKKSRSKVRVWPENPDGEYINVSLTGAAALREPTKDAISKLLSAKMSVEVSRLFYDHTIEQSEAHEKRAASGANKD